MISRTELILVIACCCFLLSIGVLKSRIAIVYNGSYFLSSETSVVTENSDTHSSIAIIGNLLTEQSLSKETDKGDGKRTPALSLAYRTLCIKQKLLSTDVSDISDKVIRLVGHCKHTIL